MKSKIAEEYVKSYIVDGKLQVTKRAIANQLFTKYPHVFKSLEQARHNVRYVTGTKGKQSRKKRLDKKELFVESKKFSDLYGIEEGEKNNFKPHICNGKRVLIISDIHIPYHNLNAIEKAINYGIKNKMDTIIINGDLMDCYMISSFQKDPRKRSMADEIEMARNFLHKLADNTKVPIIFKLGNHEERWEHYLKSHAPALLEIAEFRLDIILRLAEKQIQYVTNKRPIKLGNLNILHGHEFGRFMGSSVNPARTAWLRAKENILIGHHHNTSEHIEKNLSGKVHGAWSVGCLSDLNPEYMPINKYNLGFAFVEINEDNFIVHNEKIITHE